MMTELQKALVEAHEELVKAHAEIERLRSALYAIVGQLENAEDALNVVYRECEEAINNDGVE